MSTFTRPALFLDRDGVINIDHGYVYKTEGFEFVPGIFDLVRAANENDYLVIVITNQAGIGRGYYTEHDFLSLSDWMCQRFVDHNAKIDDVFFCPFHPVHGTGKYKIDSQHRKPGPGMIIDAIKKHNIDPSKSLLIGDKTSDIEAGKAAGIPRNILYTKMPSDESRVESIDSLFEAIPLLG